VREVAGDLFALDSRLWRTVGPLLVRPGFLTREHFAGRRVRYVPPLRLYVFVAIVFFGVMTVTDGGPLRLRVQASPTGTAVLFGEGRGRGGGRLDFGTVGSPAADATTSAADSWLAERVARVRENPDEYNAAVFATLSNIHFLLLPIFALLMMPFWRRRYAIEHVVFGMHYHAFALLLGSGFLVASSLVGESSIVGAILRQGTWFALLLYLYLAVRRVYGGRWWAAALKVVAFSFLYTMSAVFLIIAVAGVTAAFF